MAGRAGVHVIVRAAGARREGRELLTRSCCYVRFDFTFQFHISDFKFQFHNVHVATFLFCIHMCLTYEPSIPVHLNLKSRFQFQTSHFGFRPPTPKPEVETGSQKDYKDKVSASEIEFLLRN